MRRRRRSAWRLRVAAQCVVVPHALRQGRNPVHGLAARPDARRGCSGLSSRTSTLMGPQSTAAEIARAVAAGRTGAVEVVEAALARIGQHNPMINAFTDVLAERARATAGALDARRTAGVPPGPLAGVPFAVKNLFDVAGLPTRAGSKINRERPPATADATLITRLETAGAVLVGALNM